MAESLSHKFGQIIGDLLELAVIPNLAAFVQQNNLYLDKKGKRLARKGTKVSWVDLQNNKHDLDYVIERNGSDHTVGDPVAFIEIAWRRYTKHSRNKAQEIHGAIIPLSEKFKHLSPFKGVILAGNFTAGSLDQLSSHGFKVLYFPYDTVVAAFAEFGIDAAFDENTPEADFRKKIDAWNALSNKSDVAIELLSLNADQVRDFFSAMTKSILRYVQSVQVLPLFGNSIELNSVQDAMDFIKTFDVNGTSAQLVRIEVIIKYNTGDVINGSFVNKQYAVDFLKNYI